MRMGRTRWNRDGLTEAVQKSQSVRQVIKALGLIPAGGNYVQVNKYIVKYALDTSHFTGQGWSKGLKIPQKPIRATRDVLTKNSDFQSYKLKKRLFEERLKEVRCEMCSWAKVSPDGRIPLELDHINGDRFDNRLQNLRILCPNCHSLQPTHRGRNKKSRGGETGRRATLKML